MDFNALLKELEETTPENLKIQASLSFETANKINAILKKRNIDQKEFARLMKKSESQISKWLTGTHNFTYATIAKIQDVLEEQIIRVSKKNEVENTNNSVFIIKSTAYTSINSTSQGHTYPSNNETKRIRLN